MNNTLCIVVPILNEEQLILEKLDYLNSIKAHCDLLFVDGNSIDNSAQLLINNQFKVITSPQTGRGAQLSYGVKHVENYCSILLLLHIDTKLPDNFVTLVKLAIRDASWGFFRIYLNSDKLIFQYIRYFMNIRSSMTNIATGDQAIFVKKDLLLAYCNEISQHPLMEDIYISKILRKKHGKAKVIQQPAYTSTRYWEKHGVFKTVLKMWAFRFLYFIGFSPSKLYKLYYK